MVVAAAAPAAPTFKPVGGANVRKILPHPSTLFYSERAARGAALQPSGLLKFFAPLSTETKEAECICDAPVKEQHATRNV